MPLLCTVISRRTTLLCEYGDKSGKLRDVIKNILAEITLKKCMKTIQREKYLFHYICADKLIYMCISDTEFPTEHAFIYLSEIKTQFLSNYGLTAPRGDSYDFYLNFLNVIIDDMNKCNITVECEQIKRDCNAEDDESKEIVHKKFLEIEEPYSRAERKNLRKNVS